MILKNFRGFPQFRTLSDPAKKFQTAIHLQEIAIGNAADNLKSHQ